MQDVRIAGYASVFGVPDSGGDVVLPGAFEVLAARVPLLWQHDTKEPVGFVEQMREDARGLRVAFPDGQGGVRWVLPARLDAVETVFAMTVHKSQGSEFDHVALVLPDRPVAVLTRELLYTGMTRAKTRLTLVVPQAQVLWHAVAARVLRSGGLTDL